MFRFGWYCRRLAVLATLAIATAGSAQAQLPSVTSGTLVLQLKADAATVITNGSGHVTSWAASNDPSIVLTSTGNTPANITYLATGMNGVPTVKFIDAGGQNQWLRGNFPVGLNLTNATIFWLGYHANVLDSSGYYVYTIGTDAGSGASQFSHQKDNGTIEIYNGETTFVGADIDARDEVYTVWRTEHHGGTPVASHRAYADGVNLNVASNSVGYNVNPDPHPIYVGGFQGGGFNFQGVLSELLVYQGVLSAEDISAIECYLQARRTGLPAPDCNSSGTSDCVDLGNDTAADCNLNRIPDSCDISSGTSQDTNTNGLPDTCEVVQLRLDDTNLTWADIDAVVLIDYDVVRGDVGTLQSSNGNFTSSTNSCLANDHFGLTWPHGIDPVPSLSYWYLVRANLPTGPPLTYDTRSPRQSGSRDAEINASPNSCP